MVSSADGRTSSKSGPSALTIAVAKLAKKRLLL